MSQDKKTLTKTNNLSLFSPLVQSIFTITPQLQESKAALEKELEDSSKSTTVVQNITYNIQDSAISGDITANLKPKDE